MFRTVSLAMMLSLLASGCSEEFKGVDHPTDDLHFPVSIVADPAGDYIYVVNTNFDLRYFGGNVVAIDTKTGKVVPDSAVQIASFGGEIAVLERDGKAHRLYVTARENETLTWIAVTRNADGTPKLFCADNGVDDGRVHTCNGRNVFGGKNEDTNTGEDPFGVVVQPPTDGQPGHVYTTAFDGTLTAFRLNADGDPEYVKQQELVSGAYDVAIHPLTNVVYSTNKRFARVLTVPADDQPDDSLEEGFRLDLGDISTMFVSNPTKGRDFGRSMAFSGDGTLAFVAYRTPPSLLVVDTSLTAAGRPRNQLLDTIPLGDGPAGVTVAKTGPGGAERVYVTLYNADEVAVIDPALREVTAFIRVGDGPFSLEVAATPHGVRGYVTLFEESRIGVLDLDPDSAFYHQEIARIQ